MKIVATPRVAVASVSSGMRVFVHGCAATPTVLLDALYDRRDALKEVELIHIHLEGEIPHGREGFLKSFRAVNLFVGRNVRQALNFSEIDYLPCFLSEMPTLFRENIRPIDVALLHVSPPDEHGYCSLGTSVDIARAAVDTAQVVVAQINPRMPRVHGGGFVHVDAIDFGVEVDLPLPEQKEYAMTEVERAIGAHVATLVENGSTIQTGIGTIPNAVMEALMHHKDLGVHTEVWTDPLLPLLETGVITNAKKVVHPGKTVSSFLMGTNKLYSFIDDNPDVVQFDISFVNCPEIIGKNQRVVAINSAVEVDLTGQVCADSVGSKIISGVGGQIDFMRGASLSEGGKSIIAVASRTSRGEKKLVATLKKGAGVVTTRAHTHFVVTEYGIADLFGKTLGERAKALIGIAHPDDRESLEQEWYEIVRCM